MRILFLSHYFPPEVNAPASRTCEHCKQWVADGHEVTVVTCAPNHPGGKVYPGYKNRLFQREEVSGIHVIRVWTYLAANEGFVKRTMNYMSFMIAAIAVTPFLSKADVLISTSPQFFNGLAGYFVSRMKRIPWVLEIRDLWPESILAVGAIQNKWIIRLLEALEAFAYRKADRIVPVTDSFRGHIERRLIDPRKIEVIKNGVDLTVFKVGPKENPVARDLRLEKKFVAAYVGTHGMAHGLDVVLDAAKRLEGRQDIVFLLVGDGAEKARLVRKKEEMGLRNVVMLDQQPKEKMPLLWAACDVSLVLLRKHDLFKTVIPSKIFESMAMERPIVLGVLGESAEIVKDADAGVCVEPENSDELANVVIRLCDERERTKEMGMNGRKYVEQKFDRSVLARRFEELLAELVGA